MNKSPLKYEKQNCIVCGNNNYNLLTQGKDYEYRTTNNIFNIVKCNICNHIYLNPKPTSNMSNIIYPKNYYSFNFEKIANSFSLFAKKMIDSNKIKEYKNLIKGKVSILDIGSGDGRLLSLVKSNTNWDCYGVDIDKKANEIARKKGLTIYNGQFETTKIDKKFDIIIMMQLIEHVENPKKIIKKTNSLLNKNGFLIIETPNLSNSWDFRLFKNKYWGGYHFPRHFNLFSKRNLKRLLEQSGFKLIKQENLVSPAFWIMSLHNYFYNKGYPSCFVKQFNFFNPILLAIFTTIDLVQKSFRETSNMKIIAKKT